MHRQCPFSKIRSSRRRGSTQKCHSGLRGKTPSGRVLAMPIPDSDVVKVRIMGDALPTLRTQDRMLRGKLQRVAQGVRHAGRLQRTAAKGLWTTGKCA
mmetsp:Transcript_66701/g.156362  ORF Transcript_66701/g.156362 Transcript_66701/m.156362 type:complete len:98 (+) Transcript_66701:197-490(+)